MRDKILFLAKSYHLVVGDTFELFYQGVIRSLNYDKYTVFVECAIGNPFPRYYSVTPKVEGTYPLMISLYDDQQGIVDIAKTTLIVKTAFKPLTKKNILCFGDSLTFNGVWPSVGYERFTKSLDDIYSLGFKDSINMIGTCKKNIDNEEIGYEGYGSWQWEHFCTNEVGSTSSAIWVNCSTHHLDENDQHSVWETGGLKWVLESITPSKLKFKRGEGNYIVNPEIKNFFTHVSGGIHHESIDIESFEYETGNPFFDKAINDISFKTYANKFKIETIDYIYILLTWNGQYKPYNKDFSHYEKHIYKILNQIHKDFPSCKVRLLGIQSPSITGGIAANYGAHGPYSDLLGTLSTAYFYDQYLEELTSRDEFKDYCKYIDTKAQFDTVYNMPYVLKPVNQRSKVTEMIGTNGVHPNMDGYNQIGDVFFRILCHDMAENK